MPDAKQGAWKGRALFTALAFLFALSLTYRIRDTIDRTDELANGHRIAQIPFDIDLPNLTVTGVEPEAAAAGLKVGDVLAGVNGSPIRGTGDLFVPLRDTAAGDVLRLDVDASSSGLPVRRTVPLTLKPMRDHIQPSTGEWAGYLVVQLALPYLCLALGFWVAAVRIRDRMAWLLLLLLLSLAEFAGGPWRTLWGRSDWFQPISAMYQPALAILWPTSMMLFGIYFPERLNLDRRLPWAKWMVMVPILITVAVSLPLVALMVTDLRAAIPMDRAFGRVEPLVGILQFAAISIFFGALGFKAFTERRPDARRRLRLLHAGAFIAITPLCIVLLLVITGLVEFQLWFLTPLLSVLFIFPLTMAYVILVHRAMDVRVVVRQGLQYLLARGSIRVLQIAVSIVVFWMVMTMRPGGIVPIVPAVQAGFVLLGVGAIMVIRRFAERLGRWVDRRFFREAYDAERILTDLASRVRTMVETRPLLEMVAQQVSTSLHVPRVAILLKGAGALAPAYAVGYGDLPTVPLGDRGFTEDSERELKQELGAELVLPLSSNTEVIGVMGLGPKRSEAPFTPGDVRLLTAVAAQTGLAIENSRLTAEVAAEVALRERAQREIEIAREVQERLFPQDYPPLPGVEYAGACRPALGVGGDYYDFIKFSDTELGIAIGDVSGKGIPAALLMATLRAYLRGQTIRRDSDLGAMMANLNRLVYESSAPNRYATFFYAQYETTTRVLQYVNAGHNPPMIFRAAGDIARLDVGGPVIGLIEGCAYDQGTVALEPGDVFVAYTDGVSEAMNGEHEEWGEDQLAATTLPARAVACQELIARIMRAADNFVAGAPQHDDMTLVVVRQL